MECRKEGELTVGVLLWDLGVRSGQGWIWRGRGRGEVLESAGVILTRVKNSLCRSWLLLCTTKKKDSELSEISILPVNLAPGDGPEILNPFF